MPFDQEKEMAAQAGCGQSALIPYLEDPLLALGFLRGKALHGLVVQCSFKGAPLSRLSSICKLSVLWQEIADKTLSCRVS